MRRQGHGKRILLCGEPLIFSLQTLLSKDVWSGACGVYFLFNSLVSYSSGRCSLLPELLLNIEQHMCESTVCRDPY